MTAMRKLAPVEGKPKITITEFEKMSESYHRYELIDGEIVAKPMTKFNHSRIARRIMQAYDRLDPEEKLGAISHEVNFHLNETYSPAPDVAIWKAGRIPNFNTPMAAKPDVAIEIQSNDQSLQELTLKAKLYLVGGIPLVWVIQPNKKIAAVFRQGQAEPETIQPDGVLDADEIIPGFKVSLESLFEGSSS